MRGAAAPGRAARRAVVAAATAAALTASASLASSAAAVAAGTRYARVHAACGQPRPHRARCLALNLVPVTASARGAVPYEAGAGTYASGPAGGFTPGDLATAYGYGAATGGGDQTIGIVDAYDDPTLEADLATFDSQYGLSSCT